jgi:hypothetical protein
MVLESSQSRREDEMADMFPYIKAQVVSKEDRQPMVQELEAALALAREGKIYAVVLGLLGVHPKDEKKAAAYTGHAHIKEVSQTELLGIAAKLMFYVGHI